MSAGNFVVRVYESNAGTFHNLKAQPESAVLSLDGSPNTIPAGPVDSPFWAKASRQATEFGLRPRKVRIAFEAGSEPTGYKPGTTLTCVVYSRSVFDAAVIGAPVTYLGASGTLSGKIAEDIYPAS